jgi:hypothetical protein
MQFTSIYVYVCVCTYLLQLAPYAKPAAIPQMATSMSISGDNSSSTTTAAAAASSAVRSANPFGFNSLTSTTTAAAPVFNLKPGAQVQLQLHEVYTSTSCICAVTHYWEVLCLVIAAIAAEWVIVCATSALAMSSSTVRATCCA